MGKLIIIEGLDGCGKSTQTALLQEYFEKNSINFKKIKLPDYDSKSSALVKMYLAGEFGKDASDVNAYAAGAFYAVDRFASYKLDWGKDYENGTLILADRYATSNSIYQMEKIDESKWDEYLEWSADFEYNKIGIPKPDLVIFLDITVMRGKRTSMRLMLNFLIIAENQLYTRLVSRDGLLYLAQTVKIRFLSRKYIIPFLIL